MKLSIIIPCYNEEHTINALLDTIFKVKFPIEREIIVIDDGSTVNHKQFVLNEI
ncbi:MAG: glycosyltransferase family 2 protein, partial [Promethearchaeota archaeon]